MRLPWTQNPNTSCWQGLRKQNQEAVSQTCGLASEAGRRSQDTHTHPQGSEERLAGHRTASLSSPFNWDHTRAGSRREASCPQMGADD